MAVGIKYGANKTDVYSLNRKKHTPTKSSERNSKNSKVSQDDPSQQHISDELELSSQSKAAQSYLSNTQADTDQHEGQSLPVSNAQAAQVAQNSTQNDANMLAEQLLETSSSTNVQAIIEELMAANDNALQAFIKNLLSANETSLQSMLQSLLNSGDNAHILDFITSIMAPDRNENESGGSVDDPTRRLTRRLVSARTTHEIHHILSEATKSLGDAILAAASGDEEAKQIVRRLTRLIRRATRKIGDLNSEDQVRRNEARARERELEELARQYEKELRRKIAERERRERGYLRNLDDDDHNVLPLPGTLSSGSLTAAQIKAMAWQAAKASISAQSATPSMPAGSIGGGSVSGGNTGGEASLSGGAGGSSGEAAPGGDAA